MRLAKILIVLLAVSLLWTGCTTSSPTEVAATPTPVTNPADQVDARPPGSISTPEPVATVKPPVGGTKPGPARQVEQPPKVRKGPVIQIALLLDTSQSMDGLILQAQTRLWSVVSKIADASVGDEQAQLEVALYQYGSNRKLPSSTGFIRQVVPFTTDLDAVSEELFRLTCVGGLENCPWAVETAAVDLDWSQDPRDLKVIFIAGNEAFEQGPVETRHALKKARERGIIVNTIFCGETDEGALFGWDQVAAQSGGTYVAIDQSRTEIAQAPQDAKIAALNDELNSTYIPYGEAGEEGKARQVAQDQAVSSKDPQALTVRAAAKSTGVYRNANWDLVDAAETGDVDAGKLPDDAYPKAMRSMTPSQRESHVKETAQRRAEIKKQIGDLVEEREQHVSGQRSATASASAPAPAALDDAMTETLRTQAKAKGYEFR